MTIISHFLFSFQFSASGFRFIRFHLPVERGPGTYCMGDSAHALQISDGRTAGLPLQVAVGSNI